MTGPPRGVWLIARASTDEPYPCACNTSRGCRQGTSKTVCPCWRRGGILDHLPQACCGRTSRPSKEDR